MQSHEWISISHSGSSAQGPFIWPSSEQRINIETRPTAGPFFQLCGTKAVAAVGRKFTAWQSARPTKIIAVAASPASPTVFARPVSLRASGICQRPQSIPQLHTVRFPPTLSRPVPSATRPIRPPRLASRSPASQPARQPLRAEDMNSSGRYRIRSPIQSPRRSSSRSRPRRSHGVSDAANTSANVDTSDLGSDSDSDTVIDGDSGREEGLSPPHSRDASMAPGNRNFPRFAGLHDEDIPNQSLAATIPYEIILHIFRFLEPFGQDNYNCLLVCKAWTKCAVESVWFRPGIKNLSTYRKMTSILPPYTRKTTTFFPYAQFIRRLNLLNIAKELTPSLFLMLECCTQLERLTMGGAIQINDDAVTDVIPNFKRLLALDISGADLGDQGLCAIADGCRLLQGLNVSHCTRLTDKSIGMVAENCPGLRRVLITYLPNYLTFC